MAQIRRGILIGFALAAVVTLAYVTVGLSRAHDAHQRPLSRASAHPAQTLVADSLRATSAGHPAGHGLASKPHRATAHESTARRTKRRSTVTRTTRRSTAAVNPPRRTLVRITPYPLRLRTSAPRASLANSSAGRRAPSQNAAVTTTAIPVAVQSAAPSAAALYRATGLTPSQVTAQPECTVARPGYARCDSEVLVAKSTGDSIQPLGSTAQENEPKPFTPAFLQEAYDTSELSANDGSGQTVAIVDAYNDPDAMADLTTFRSQFGLPAISTTACTPGNITTNTGGTPCMVVANQDGATGPLPTNVANWSAEESLDVDAVSSVCPNCNILLIETTDNSQPNLSAGDAEAVQLGAKLISNSFDELTTPSVENDAFTAAEDQTGDAAGSETFASTGDTGSYIDDSVFGQTSPYEFPYPASEPGITAVGGTTLDPSSNARGVTEEAWDGSGSACALGETEPEWQLNADTGCNGRAVSDISADADPATGLEIYDSFDGGWGYVGGTSLAAPLTAAYTAITRANADSTTNGDGSRSAEWAYADAPNLNDAVGGRNSIFNGPNGPCVSGVAYQYCKGGPGWDGPTGVGTISGAIESGGPSLTVPIDGGLDSNGYSDLAALSETNATFEGGVYPNGSATTVWWEYGTDPSGFNHATSTTAQNVGSGTDPVLASDVRAMGLTAGTTYYVEECASNTNGSICGNEMSFSTPSSAAGALDATDPPQATDRDPLTVDASTVSDVLSSSTGGYLNQSSVAFAYQWYRGADATAINNINENLTGGCHIDCPAAIAGAQSSTYQLTSADAGEYVFAVVTGTTGGATSTALTNQLGPVQTVTAPVERRLPSLSHTNLEPGGIVSLNSPSWSPGSSETQYQWQESSDDDTWNDVGSSTSNPVEYVLQISDNTKYLRAKVSATNAGGTATAYSNTLQVSMAPETGGTPVVSFTAPDLGGLMRLGTVAWSPAATSVSYQWQESSDGSTWGNLGSATATSTDYTVGYSDSQKYIRAQIVATNGAGTTTVDSTQVQMEDMRPVALVPHLTRSSGGSPGGLVSVSTVAWIRPAVSTTYQWQESSDGTTWTNLGTPDMSTPTSYAITWSDSKKYIRLEIAGTNPAGTNTWDTNSVQAPNLVPQPTTYAPGPTDDGLGIGDHVYYPTQTWSESPTSMSYQWMLEQGGNLTTPISAPTTAPTPLTITLALSGERVEGVITASNAAGSTTVYTSDLYIPTINPKPSGNLTITASSLTVGGILSMTGPTWSSDVSHVSYGWQERTLLTGPWVDLGDATNTPANYTITQNDLGSWIRAVVIATNGIGISTVTSDAVEAIANTPRPPINTSTFPSTFTHVHSAPNVPASVIHAPSIAGAPTVGALLSITGGRYADAGRVTVSFERCAHSCSTVQSSASTIYKLRGSDVGYYVVAHVDVAGAYAGGDATSDATGLIGPVVSAEAGALKITGANATIKSATHVALVDVRRTVTKPKKRRTPSTYVLTVTRAPKLKASVSVWACLVRAAKLVSCTRATKLDRITKINQSVPAGDTVEVIAVRR